MNPDALFWLALGGLLGTTFAAIGSYSLRKFSRHTLEEVCRKHDNSDRFREILHGHDRVALAVEIFLVLAVALLVVAGTYWAWDAANRPDNPNIWIVITGAVGAGLVLAAATVWFPWAASRLYAEDFIYHTWRIWQFIAALMKPLVGVARFLSALMHRLAGKTPVEPNEDTFEEEIRTIVTEGHREGLLEEEAREMIEGVMELRDADVAEIMTPRTDMHMVQVHLPFEEFVADAIQSGHTRIPVYDKNRDDIVGVLYSKDLLPELAKPTEQSRRSMEQIMRRPVFVPESKAVDDLLAMFQQLRTHIAIVLDEYGGVAGLVTIEDALEEIVGEIVDEYDEEVLEELEQINGTTWEAMGRTHVDEINSALQLDLPDDADYDTIAGFVFSQLGRIPSAGEIVNWNGQACITVLEATRRRIDRVRIERLDQERRETA